MAGNAAEISLSSNALLLLGHQPIASFTEGTAGSQVAENLFEHSYKAVLTTYRWRFATKQAKLARLVATPNNVYTYQFQLPVDLLYLIRAVSVYDYEIYEDKLYTNEESIDIEYTYNVSADKLPSHYAKMFEFYLAAQFSIPITGDLEKAQFYNAKYERALSQAKFADASQRPNQEFEYSPYADARH